jgi:D-alanyl-D-alanine carboxypeptidase
LELVLVNPTHKLPDDFSVQLVMTRYGYEVDSRIVKLLEEMIDAAKADGVDLLICYGYRTLEQATSCSKSSLAFSLPGACRMTRR